MAKNRRKLIIKSIWETPYGIKEIRKQFDVNIGKLASYMRTSRATIGHWESGERKPSGANTMLLAILGRAANEIQKAKRKHYEDIMAGKKVKLRLSESYHCRSIDVPIEKLILKNLN